MELHFNSSICNIDVNEIEDTRKTQKKIRETSIASYRYVCNFGRPSRKYLQKVNYNYRGIFSAPVLSELFLSILRLESNVKRYASMDVIADLISTRKIDFYTPRNIYDISKKIKDLDTRITPTDIEIIACAIEHKAVNLVTLDKILIGNTSIEKEFKIRIRHPKDLL